MHLSAFSSTKDPIRAYRRVESPATIWIAAGSVFAAALDPDEAQLLIAELQRELAVVEAAARGVAA